MVARLVEYDENSPLKGKMVVGLLKNNSKKAAISREFILCTNHPSLNGVSRNVKRKLRKYILRSILLLAELTWVLVMEITVVAAASSIGYAQAFSPSAQVCQE
jgi:hypothetical protein